MLKYPHLPVWAPGFVCSKPGILKEGNFPSLAIHAMSLNQHAIVLDSCVLCIQKKLSCVERKIPFWPSLNNAILTHGVLSSLYFSDTLASCWKNVPSLNVHWSDDPRLMRTLAKWRLWTGLKPLGKPKVKSKAERDQKIGKPFVHGKELQALQK